MSELNTDFPKSSNNYLKAEQFQDQEIPVTYLGWKKKSNVDYMKDGALVKSWKQKIKYCLRYSYPEFAIDEAGEQILKDGSPVRNKNYDPNFPHGYTVVYVFDEGTLESGSLPLFNGFCFIRPQKGDKILLKRTGSAMETEWSIKKITNAETKTKEQVFNDDFSDEPPF